MPAYKHPAAYPNMKGFNRLLSDALPDDTGTSETNRLLRQILGELKTLNKSGLEHKFIGRFQADIDRLIQPEGKAET